MFFHIFVLNLKNIIAGIIIQFCERAREQTQQAVPLFALGKAEPLQSQEMRPVLPSERIFLTQKQRPSITASHNPQWCQGLVWGHAAPGGRQPLAVALVLVYRTQTTAALVFVVVPSEVSLDREESAVSKQPFSGFRLRLSTSTQQNLLRRHKHVSCPQAMKALSHTHSDKV